MGSERRLFAPRRLLPFCLAAFALSPVACDCDVEPVTRIECIFEVDPSGDGETIEFPGTEVGEARSRTFNITNTGNVKLGAFDFDFETRNAEHYDVIDGEDFEVDPGDEGTLTIEFHPLADTLLASSFTVSHEKQGDSKCPTFTVFLRGDGFIAPDVDAGFPDAGFPDGGPPPDDAGVDAGVVDLPDGGVILVPDSEWFAYGGLEDARTDFAMVQTAPDRLFVIGGYGEEGEALDTIEVLDPIVGRSRIVGRMAVPRGAPGAALLIDGQTIAIVGGRSSLVNGFSLTSVELFNTATGVVSCPAPQNGCGLDALGAGVLAPDGRIGPFAAATANGLMVGLGRTLDVDGNEVPEAGGELITFGANVSAAPLGSQNLLTPRVGEAVVAGPGGSVFLIGGRTPAPASAALPQILKVDAATSTVSSAGNLSASRADAAATVLSGDRILVAGGHNTAGFGVTAAELISGAFAGTPSVASANVDLPVRVGGSLVGLPGGIVVFAGGTTVRSDDDDPLLSLVPQAGADVLVPFGATFLVLDAENGLAHPRLKHRTAVVGTDGDQIVFVAGTSVSPRPRPHPHVERFLLTENRFLTFGLMGQGTAIEAGLVPDSGAAAVSAGGVDPHTGAVSAAVRAFDATNGIFVETTPLLAPRRDHTLTRTSITDDQTLLVAGGRDATGQVIGTLSILDPINDRDLPLPVQLITPRAQHSATRLAEDNPIAPGAILICGGVGNGGAALDSCEVVIPPPEPLDPDSYVDAAVITVTGRLAAGRVSHSATLLDTGEVLLMGGGDIAVDQVRADLFVPDEDTPFLQTTGLPVLPRRQHTAVLLGSGRVLIVGGEAYAGAIAGTRTAEVYQHANRTFTAVEDMEEERIAPGAFLLGNGNVLVSGGTRSTQGEEGVPSRSNRRSELYVAGPTGLGTFEELVIDNLVELSYGRSDGVPLDLFGRAVMIGGNHRDGSIFTGGERRTPITFVDWLRDPAELLDGGTP